MGDSVNSLREIGYALCVVLVVTGIFLILLPSGNTVKTAKFSVNLFLIISVINPFFNKKIDFSSVYDYEIKENIVYENLNDLYNSKVLESFENELKNRIETVFLKYDIIPKKINVIMNVKTNKSIDINKIEITLKSSDRMKSDTAIKEINEMFSLITSVSFI